ncbi:MAG: fibronectin type III domain-containing protein [Lachnospiraceae bacterium]|nr:fibronectin type III domain-containing protein [Lachnospiraceae bacterium]
MYKDVAKRILASVLIFAMVGSTPDWTLLATEGSSTGISSGDGIELISDTEVKDIESEDITVEYEDKVTYDGTVHKPVLVVKDGGTQLQEGTDYTLTYCGSDQVTPDEMIDWGTKYIIVTGIGSYSGERPVLFTIERKKIEESMILSDIPNQLQSSIDRNVIDGLKIGNSETDLLEAGTDYTIACKAVEGDTTQVDVTITGAGNYRGSIEKTVTIGADINAYTATFDDAIYAGGKAVEPSIVLMKDNKPNTNFTVVEWKNNINACAADAENAPTVVLVGSGTGEKALAGTMTVHFTISPRDIGTVNIDYEKSIPYQKSAEGAAGMESTVKLTYGGAELTAEDYSVSYSDNTAVTTEAKITLTGTGNNYTGTKELTYTIEAVDVNDLTYLPQELEEIPYTGSAIKPELTIQQNGVELEEGTDYEMSFKDADGVSVDEMVTSGSYTVVINGKGNYTSEKELPFEVGKIDIANATVSIEKEDWDYTGSAIKPEITVSVGDLVLSSETDYVVGYSNSTNAGKATITIRAKDGSNYTGEKKTYYNIIKSLSESTITVADISAIQYTGVAVEPSVIVADAGVGTLIQGEDYELSYSNNDAVGTATVTITGIGYYTGTKKVSFEITKGSLENATVAFADANDLTFTGSGVEPKLKVSLGKVELVEGEHYEIVYEYNTNVENSSPTKAIVNGIGSFEGSKSLKFDIVPKDIADSSIEVFIEDMDAIDLINGIKPIVTVMDMNRDKETGEAVEPGTGGYELAQNGEYTLGKASANGTVGTIEITGAGNYQGSQTVEFTVLERELAEGELTVYLPDSEKEKPYNNGQEVVPIPEVTIGTGDGEEKLEYNVGFTVSSGKSEVGTGYSFTVHLIGYDAAPYTSPQTFDIVPKNLSDADVTMPEIENQPYTGEAIEPVVELTYNDTIIDSSNYTVTYDNNTEQGSNAVITITAVGKNYTGTKKVTFKICRNIQDGITVSTHDSYTYTSGALCPIPIVKVDGTTLRKDFDYKVEYENNVNAKNNAKDTEYYNPNNAKLKIIGIGDYAGEYVHEFVIEQKNLMDASEIKITVDEVEFTGGALKPVVDIIYTPTNTGIEYKLLDRDAAKEQGKAVDYDVQFASDSNVGENVTIQIQASGINFTTPNNAMITKEVKVVPKKLLDDEGDWREDYIVSAVVDMRYNASITEYKQNFQIYDRKRNATGAPQEASDQCYQLVEGEDYRITYRNNTTPGTATYIVEGLGNYSGKYTGTFEITANLNQVTVQLEEEEVYTGKAIIPRFTVMLGTKILNEGEHYNYQVSNNINVGTATLRIIGLGGYAGSEVTKTFEIVPKDIATLAMSGIGPSYSYTGEDVKPLPSFEYNGAYLQNEEDFMCVYDNPCSAPGKTFTVTVMGIGNYTGTVTKTYVIGTNFTEDKIKIELSEGPYIYTGNPIRPTVTVSKRDTGEVLIPDVDYTFDYTYNLNAGTAYVNAYGIPGEDPLVDGYAGNVSVSFEIEAKSIADEDVEIGTVLDETFKREAIEPTPTVLWKKADGQTVELFVGEDFEYVYENNIEAGTATVTVKGMNNYSGEVPVEFEIFKKKIDEANSGVTIEPIENQVYTGKAVEPKPTVVWDGIPLEEGKDYTVTYEGDNVELGEAKLIVTGTGSYEGILEQTFKIIEVPVEDMTIKYDTIWTYTSKPIEPAVTIWYEYPSGDEVQIPNELFTIEYSNTIDSGKETGTIVITSIDKHYIGAKTCHYTIEKRNLSDSSITVDDVPNQTIDGTTGKAEPVPTVTFKPDATTTITLVSGADYTVSYSNNTSAGQNGIVTVTGKGNFTGTATKQFYIGEDIKNYIDSINFKETPQYIYNGKAQTPEIVINLKTNANLVEGQHYEILYDGVAKDEIVDDAYATKAGRHKVTVSGLTPYGGIMELEYDIAQKDISKVDFTTATQEYTGSPICPLIIGNDEMANTRLGEDESTASVTGDISVEGMLTNLNAFTTSYQGNHTDIGTVTVEITATEKSNYCGTTTMQFAIVAKDLLGESIESNTIEMQNYTGNEIKPEIVIKDKSRNTVGTAYVVGVDTDYYTLVEGQDYDVTYTDNIYPGTVTVTITGKNHYTGTLSKMFEITADLSMAEIAPIPAQGYTGNPVTPELVVTLGEKTLVENFDYTVTYANNVDRGTATATISPVAGSMFTGSQTVSFEISRELNEKTTEVKFISDSFVYTGDAITPKPAVMFGETPLVEGTDYTIVSYTNNINVGTATLTIAGMGSYEGTMQKNFEIVRRSIIRCTFENVVDQLYSGAVTGQNVVVKDGNRTLVENTDYTVTYANNVNPGAASVIITGAGNYAGVKTVHYMINVRDMGSITGKAVSDKIVQISWSPVVGAQGYAIYNTNNDLIGRTTSTTFKHKKLKAMKNYNYKVRAYVVSDGVTYYGGFSNTIKVMTLPAKPKVKVKAGDDQIKISWKKIKGVSGYVIYRSTKKSGKYKKIKTLKKASNTSYTNTNLSSGKRYFYKVRAYKTVKGKKIYSKYSTVRSTWTY